MASVFQDSLAKSIVTGCRIIFHFIDCSRFSIETTTLSINFIVVSFVHDQNNKKSLQITENSWIGIYPDNIFSLASCTRPSIVCRVTAVFLVPE